MKKFFLSAAVMLATATMNVNAMSDSWIFHEDVEEMCYKAHHNSQEAIKLALELERLLDEFKATYPADSPESIMLLGVDGQLQMLTIEEIIPMLRAVKEWEGEGTMDSDY